MSAQAPLRSALVISRAWQSLSDFIGWLLGSALLIALCAVVMLVLHGIAVATGTDNDYKGPTSESQMDGWEQPDRW